MNRSRALGVGPRPTLAAWVHHHRTAASDSLQKLLLEPLSTLLTWLVVGIALALPAALLVLLDNTQSLAGSIDMPARFSLFLDDALTVDDARSVAGQLAQRVDIDEVAVLDREAALIGFARDTGLDGLMASLDDNPLPHTLLVTPLASLTSDRLEGLAQALAGVDGVVEVIFDTQWVARLEATLALLERLVVGLGAMMAVGAVLILGNTIRLAIEARRAEIIVIKLIGGGDAFARRPFLYTGLWCGIGGGVLAVGLVSLFLALLAAPAQQLLTLYASGATLNGLSVVGALQLILVGGALGLISAWQSTTLHLKRVEPR